MPVRAALPQRQQPRPVGPRIQLLFWLDAAIFTAYLLAFSVGFTGIAVHEWVGLALAVVLILHLTLHWAWVVRTTRRSMLTGARRDPADLRGEPAPAGRAMTLCVLSGILISTVAPAEPGIVPGGAQFWRSLHGATAVATLILVGIHVALRWRWITGAARRAMRRVGQERR